MEAGTLSIIVALLSYFVCRQTALRLGQQTDVVSKRPSEHFEDMCVLAFFVLLLVIWRPSLGTVPALVTVPIASAVFAWVSNLPALRSSLNKPSKPLLAVLAVVASSLLAVVGVMCHAHPDAMLPMAVVLGGAGLYTLCLWAASRADARAGYDTRVHVHHWQIGLVLASMLACVDSGVGAVMGAIGLAVFVHGNSVYRLTSPFCGWRVPCSATSYSQVPNVPVAS